MKNITLKGDSWLNGELRSRAAAGFTRLGEQTRSRFSENAGRKQQSVEAVKLRGEILLGPDFTRDELNQR